MPLCGCCKNLTLTEDTHTMPEFTKVAQLSSLSDPGKLLVEIDERLVALFHVDGKVYAIDDVCTHDGGPLAEGVLVGCEITCPRHAAKFDIRDGRALTMPATAATASHEVKVDGDDVFVKINES